MLDTKDTPLVQSDNADNAHELIPVLAQAEQLGLAAAGAADTLQCEMAIGLVPPCDAVGRVNAALAAGPATTRALDAIAPFFHPDDVIELRAFDPARGGAVSINGRLNIPAERAAMEAFIAQHNGRKNLYYGVNPRRAHVAGASAFADTADVDVRRVTVLDLDFKEAPKDDPDWSRTLEGIRSVTDVTAVIDTGNGLHVVLPLKDGDTTDVATSGVPLKAAMARLGADDLADAPRVARLPCTVNLPTASKRRHGRVPVMATPRHAGGGASACNGPLTVADLRAALEGVADRLALPGKRGTAGATSAHTAAGGGTKTPHAAPSADLLRMAVEALPNDGPFDDRREWVKIGMGIKSAAIAGGFEDVGREVWLEWCERWIEGGDPAEAERVWDSMTDPHVGWGTLMTTLRRVNSAGGKRVDAAIAAASYANAAATNIAALGSTTLTPVVYSGAAAISPREWLCGNSVIAGYISMLVAPGGTGKSALSMAEAVAMATGRNLLGDQPHHALRVWGHNAEDDGGEMARRLAAVMLHYGLTNADLGGRLILTSGRDMALKLARQGQKGPEITPGVADALVAMLRDQKIDVWMLDPLGAMHELPENSNEAANMLMGLLREIAERAGVAIIIVHHTGKAAGQNMDASGASASRGASAFTDAARSVRQMRPMSKDEATKFGISQDVRWRYTRVDNGKANLAPAQSATWFRLASVALGNGTPHYPAGDNVQTVEPWTPPAVAAGHAVSDADILTVQEALNGAGPDRRMEHTNSLRGWVGFLIAEALNMDVGPMGANQDSLTPQQLFARQEMKTLIQSGVADGWLAQTTERSIADRHDRKCIAAGRVQISEAADADVETTYADVETTDADVGAGDGR